MNEPLNALDTIDIKEPPTKFDILINITFKLLIAFTGIAIGCVLGVMLALFTGLADFAC